MDQKMEIVDYTNTCRFCLQYFPLNINKILINELIERRYQNVTQAELRKSQFLSVFICEACFDNLKSFNSFKDELIERQMKLNSLIDSLESEIISNDNKMMALTYEMPETVQQGVMEIEQIDDDIKYEIIEECNDQEETPTEIPDIDNRFQVIEEYQYDDREDIQQTENDDFQGILEEVEYSSIKSEISDDEKIRIQDLQRLGILNAVENETEGTYYVTDMTTDMSDDPGNRDKSRRAKLTPEEKVQRRKDLRKVTTICQECGKHFPKADFKRHFERVHLKLKNYVCDLCGYRCYLKNHMQTHMVTHTREKNYACDECNKTFATRSQVNLHKVSIHSDERPFVCCDCGKAFKMKGALEKHRKYIHTRELQWPKYPCEECGSNFNCRKKLNEHKTIHTGKPGLSCDICGKQFFVKRQLRHHKVRTHEEPKFECAHCSKKFYFNNDLIDHEKTHTGQRDYKCPYCDLKYFKRPHLHRHVKNHHMKMKFKCEISGCISKFARKETYRNHVLAHHKDIGHQQLQSLLERIRREKLQILDPEVIPN